jgi:hypothetical protein
MTSVLFLGFVAAMSTLVVAVIARYLGLRSALRILVGLCVWFLYAGLMSYLGVTGNSSTRPPGIAYIVVPVLLFLVFVIVRPSTITRAAQTVPFWIILGTQSFRVGVELFLHQLWIEGLVPRMLTFEGANVDIYIGASAPLIAWLATRGRSGLKLALVWNVLGLFALANVVVRAILTSPGPFNLIHAEIPNRMFGTFPFTFIPGFFVPLAVLLHVLALRSIRNRQHTAISSALSSDEAGAKASSTSIAAS